MTRDLPRRLAGRTLYSICGAAVAGNSRSHHALWSSSQFESRGISESLRLIRTHGMIQHWQSSPHQHGTLTGRVVVFTAVEDPELVDGGMVAVVLWNKWAGFDQNFVSLELR